MTISTPAINTAFDAHLAGRTDEAERGYRILLDHDPHQADALHLLGTLPYQRGAWIEGEALIRRAIALGNNAYFLTSLADLLAQRHRLPEAEAACRRALKLDPQLLAAWNNLGTLLINTGRLDEAAASFRHVLEIDPAFVHASYNLGMVELRRMRITEAEAAFRQTLAVQPAHRDAVNNLGTALKVAGRYAEAERCYRETFALAPDFADAKWNLAILLLKQGRLAEGWPYSEARYAPGRATGGIAPPRDLPQWRGEPLDRRSLVLWHEQGYGDLVQFVRYSRLLKARGLRRLTLLCPAALQPLMQTVNGFDDVVVRPSELGQHDYWCYPLSLPLHFGTTLDSIPASLPYLHALPERIDRWRARLPATLGLRVGLVWKGFSGHQQDATRSLPSLGPLAPLWAVPDITFVSLQKGAGEDEAADPPTGQPIVPLGSTLDDFADTAAVIAQLDLLITVDTAAAHVAGALGKPCSLMLPRDWSDWRWLTGRDDSPWYPGVMRLFRQSDARDWTEVATRMAEALRQWQMDGVK